MELEKLEKAIIIKKELDEAVHNLNELQDLMSAEGNKKLKFFSDVTVEGHPSTIFFTDDQLERILEFIIVDKKKNITELESKIEEL
jgi:hypothetical protein